MIEIKTYYIGFNFNVISKLSEEKIRLHIETVLKHNNINPENINFHECTKLKVELKNDNNSNTTTTKKTS